MKIIGHRGARGLALENTIEAIRAGLESGVDMIEIDLRLDEQSEVVLAHDPVTYDVDYTTLEEMLDRIQPSFPLNIELKEPEVALKLKPLLENYSAELVISSTNSKALKMAHTELPNAQIAVVEKWSAIRAVYKARSLKTRRIHMNHRWIWSGLGRSLATRGYELYAYTVNDVKRARKLAIWGLKGIFTDNPDRFVSSTKR